ELMQQASDAGYGGLVYFAFDLLARDGEDVARFRFSNARTGWRRSSTRRLPGPSTASMRAAFRKAACKHGLEGVLG
ncbi:MAG TPA: hypothetical protein VEF89_29570, partial [Solirubrobacteraceae bacterium]|nr:hypothetical protein [Solirubrobacteraceae bacterium]